MNNNIFHCVMSFCAIKEIYLFEGIFTKKEDADRFLEEIGQSFTDELRTYPSVIKPFLVQRSMQEIKAMLLDQIIADTVTVASAMLRGLGINLENLKSILQ